MASPVKEIHDLMQGDEQVKWLSFMIKEMWPYASIIAYDCMRTYIPPALRKAVPDGMPCPRLTKLELGEETPQIEAVLVRQAEYMNGSTGIIIEAQIAYHGKPNIEMSYGPATFGISEVTVCGRLEIILRPLTDHIPLFGGVQIGFINKPKLSYSLAGAAAVADHNLLQSYVQQAIEDVFGKVMVLPNRLSYKLSHTTDYFKFATPILAVIRIAVIRGDNFPATDRHPIKQFFGIDEKPDVYVKLSYGNQVHKTNIISDSTNPVWENQVFDFMATTNSSSQRLQIEAYDSDIGADDFLGQATCSIGDLVGHGVCKINLKDSPENAKPSLEIMAKWLPISTALRHVQHGIIANRSDSTRPSDCSHLILSVDIGEGSNFPSGNRPFVRVKVGKRIFQTYPVFEVEVPSTKVSGTESPSTRVQNPGFWQSFHMPLDGKIDASMNIIYEVVEFYSKNQILGYAYSSISDLVVAGEEGRTYCFALLKSANPNASLKVRVRLATAHEPEPLWKQLPTKDPSTKT